MSSSIKARTLNVSLRLMGLTTKLGLTIYMGRYFDLAEIGAYGLVFGAVTTLSAFLGFGLNYFVNRDIVGADPATALQKMRDQTIFYGLNYLALGAGGCLLSALHGFDLPPRMLFYTLFLTMLENFGTVIYFNMNSLHLQVRANGILFIRSGLWVFPVVILCAVNPALRTAETVLAAWTGGAIASIIVTLWLWRDMPWGTVMRCAIDWVWVKKGIKTGWPIWAGIAGLTAGTFVDRFVVDRYLSIDTVGVLTFYFSFTNALSTLAQSGISAFATPRMVEHHRNKAHGSFHREAGNANRQVAIGVGVGSIGLGIAIPLLGHFLGREAFVASINVLWLMLFGAWLRANAEIRSNILFARHQDRALWVGNLLFLIPAVFGNLLLVPIFGFVGIGYSAVISSAFLLIWRWWHIRRFKYS